jgi:hypothetical protein
LNNYGRITGSKREGSKKIGEKDFSGYKSIKNFSVDVKEYFNDGMKNGDNFHIQIKQNNGHKHRGLSSGQMDDHPEDLNLLFYNFNGNKKDQSAGHKPSTRISEELEENGEGKDVKTIGF